MKLTKGQNNKHLGLCLYNIKQDCWYKNPIQIPFYNIGLLQTIFLLDHDEPSTKEFIILPVISRKPVMARCSITEEEIKNAFFNDFIFYDCIKNIQPLENMLRFYDSEVIIG
jgi:hypothetical protein